MKPFVSRSKRRRSGAFLFLRFGWGGGAFPKIGNLGETSHGPRWARGVQEVSLRGVPRYTAGGASSQEAIETGLGVLSDLEI